MLPVVGETSIRLLGGFAVFAVMFLWWWTPLAPVHVKEWVVDDLTVPLGEEILTVAMVVPNGRIAVVAPPTVPPRAQQLAKLIKDTAGPYDRGLKAITEGRFADARELLKTAAEEGKPDPIQVELAQALNEMYACRFVQAAEAYQDVIRKKPDSVLYHLQAAVAWLHIGKAELAEPLVTRALMAQEEKVRGKGSEKEPDADRDLAYCLHVQAVLRVNQGRQFADAAASCAGEQTCRQADARRGRLLLPGGQSEQPGRAVSFGRQASGSHQWLR